MSLSQFILKTASNKLSRCIINIFVFCISSSVCKTCFLIGRINFYFVGDKTLDGYSKKKYVCKLLFIFLLGHDIDFGHMEAVNLLSSNKYTEKQIVRLPNLIHYSIFLIQATIGLSSCCLLF